MREGQYARVGPAAACAVWGSSSPRLGGECGEGNTTAADDRWLGTDWFGRHSAHLWSAFSCTSSLSPLRHVDQLGLPQPPSMMPLLVGQIANIDTSAAVAATRAVDAGLCFRIGSPPFALSTMAKPLYGKLDTVRSDPPWATVEYH